MIKNTQKYLPFIMIMTLIYITFLAGCKCGITNSNLSGIDSKVITLKEFIVVPGESFQIPLSGKGGIPYM